MKTKADPRHQHRIATMKGLFAQSFGGQPASPTKEISLILQDSQTIDHLIKTCAPEWPIDQINKIDLAILRLSIYELLQASVPYKVVIDEAVELAKEYGSENSAKFVNGVLGSAVQQLPSI